jgi:hypothetical protein
MFLDAEKIEYIYSISQCEANCHLLASIFNLIARALLSVETNMFRTFAP